ncbi:uncharacterized protein CTHT_0050270 [Thermochaetoides thermophila DSM 1495]|uniref:Reverse transcriptase domain-containing protein n=1 Tax=Chaetomium thermophilum (strain DSM 1495 / CBS 144.50 / IMI 039719) TaxID=759272 RepID=G0SBH3_CHATD|nr:hypothetical protein CTHT_0050270 [Thermochaetoides thermophila DSM 1495]EGS19553.1 hypothetical protein CTHT_0050270 [Thermochaetoides thermophila DSM 1495]
MYPPPPAPASFASREELEQFAWAVYDVLAGVAGRFSIRPGKHNKSASWWSEGLATARETDPVVYRKLCKEARVNFYKERISTATSSAEWGRILRWRKDAPDNRPMVMIVDGRVVSDTEQVAADEELKDAFFGALSNTPGPDGVPLAFLRHAWELVRPAARAITEGCMALGVFPQAFRQATVITLSKPGRDPRSYKGWRPITLLSTFGKGVERLLARRMTAAALCSGLLPLSVAGAIPSRSALDLVQSLVHDAETMARQGYHGLFVTLDIDSAYPSVQPSIQFQFQFQILVGLLEQSMERRLDLGVRER